MSELLIRVVAYYRMSDDKQEDSIPAQRTEVQAYAAKHGYQIIREYLDEGISGDATEKRLQFQKMLADASALGDFEVILCWDQDRFGRFDPLEAGYWIKPLRDAGIRLETIAQGRIDWEDFGGRIIYAVQQEAKHSYLRDLSRNVVRGMLAKAKEGLWLGGPSPYGYDVQEQRLVSGEMAKVETLQWMFDAYSRQGLSLHEIARQLNERGIPGPGGKLWYPNTVSRILRSPLYTGNGVWNRLHEGKYHGVANGEITPKKKRQATLEINGRAHWIDRAQNHEPLIDLATWEAVQKRLAANETPHTPHRNGGNFLFTGLVFCGHCGSVMYNATYRRDWCEFTQLLCGRFHSLKGASGCDNYRIREDELANAVIRRIQQDFLNPANLAKLEKEIRRQLGTQAKGDPARAKRLQKELVEVEADIDRGSKRLMKLPDELVPGLQKELEAAHERRKLLSGELSDLQAASGLGRGEIDARANKALAGLRTLHEQFENAKPATVRNLVRQVVSRIECRFERVPYGNKGRKWSKLTEGFIHLRPDVAVQRDVTRAGPIRMPARDIR